MKTIRKHANLIGTVALVAVLVRHEILLSSLRSDLNQVGQALFQLLKLLGLI